MNGSQAAAFPESITSYARHVIANRDGGHAAATIESIGPYARHTIANRDGVQAATRLEFANCFVSTVYTLKGRKITTRILNNGENG